MDLNIYSTYSGITGIPYIALSYRASTLFRSSIPFKSKSINWESFQALSFHAWPFPHIISVSKKIISINNLVSLNKTGNYLIYLIFKILLIFHYVIAKHKEKTKLV